MFVHVLVLQNVEFYNILIYADIFQHKFVQKSSKQFKNLFSCNKTLIKRLNF